MSRPNTGTVHFHYSTKLGRDCWHARFTLGNKKRTGWIPLDRDFAPDDEPGARAYAATFSGDAQAVRGEGGARNSVRKWFGRLHEAKEAKGLSTVKDMRGRASKWVFPIIGDKPMREVTREDGERLVTKLDAAIAAFLKDGPGKGRLAPSTAANVWGDVQHAFDEAANAKDASLRVLEVNPLANVRGPESGDDRQGQILYSDEIVALLRGEPANGVGLGVPLYRRQTYAMAVYTKARASELEALTVEDVDLAHGTITIAKQSDRKTKGRVGTKQTKTKRKRTVDIEPNVLPLVGWLVENPQGKARRLLRMPPPEDRAELLRKDLETVGVTRAALFIEGDPVERALCFHDLRDSGLTHMAVRGDSPIAIQWAGGHTDFKTTQGYLDRGKVEARRIGLPLPPLPDGLFPSDPAAEAFVNDSTADESDELTILNSLQNSATPTGIEPVLPT